jgi:hypothetical protein
MTSEPSVLRPLPHRTYELEPYDICSMYEAFLLDKVEVPGGFTPCENGGN